MALVLADRVKETTTTTGTGTVTLLGAATGYQSFAAVGNANTTYYCIAAQTGTEWEVGLGTYTAVGTTLARTTVIASSNAGSLVNFSAGTKDVFVTQPAKRTVYDSTGSTGGTDAVSTNTASTVVRRDASGNFSAGTITAALSGNASTATTATNLAGGSTGAIPYQSASATTAMLTPGTPGYVLQSNGTAAPSWVATGSTSNAIAQQDTNVTVADTLTSFTASVAASTPFYAYCSVSATTLTVSVIQGTGTIVVGAVVIGQGIQDGTTITAFGTGTGGTGTYTLSKAASFNALDSSVLFDYSTMTVTAVASGTIAVGQFLTNTPASSAANLRIPPSTYITALGTGTGGTGTYILSKSFTLTSSTVFAGGTVTTTVDGTESSVSRGGSQIVRGSPQIADLQGQILSARMFGSYGPRTLDPTSVNRYFSDYNGDGGVSSSDGLPAQRVSGVLRDMQINVPVAFGSAVGQNGPYVGVGFMQSNALDVLGQGAGIPSLVGDSSVNTVAIGHFTRQGPRIILGKYGRVGYSPDNITFVGRQFNFSLGGIVLGVPRNVTDSTYQVVETDVNVIFNTTATCTVTLGGVDTAVTGRIDNGSNTAAGTTLTVSAVAAGVIYVGQTLYSPMISGEAVTVTAFGTGTGGVGTYTVNTSQWRAALRLVSPAPSSGRTLFLRNIAAFAVNSATANVVPRVGGAAGTAILPATAGAWCTLVYEGPNWQIMASS